MSEEKKKRSLSSSVRQIFITGFLVITPLIVTVYLILFMYKLLTTDLMPVISKFADKQSITISPYLLQFFTLVIVILIIFFVGLITRMYFGRKLIKLLDSIMSRIPIAKTIYNGTKQVIDSFSMTSNSRFSKVIMVEYPRRDMWMIGFIIKDTETFMSECTTGEESYNIFIPTAPNPTSGYVAVVTKDDVKEIDVSVEDGIKFVLSVGIIAIKPSNAEQVIKKVLGKDV